MWPPHPTRPLAAAPLFPLAAFLVTLTAAVLATDVARATVPVLRGRQQAVTEAERPPDGDHYLANDISGAVDHHVLYFGTDATVLSRLKAAEVLFLGNSRLMFGLRPEQLRPQFAAAGVSYYVMGFGYSEADRFPLAIIRKFDLRPRLVVVNADGFFSGSLSDWAATVSRDTPFAARKLQFEAEVAHEVRQVVHQVVPNWLRLYGLPGLGLRRAFIAYRSRLDGTWEISPWARGTAGFGPRPLDGPEMGRGEVAAANAFKAELDQRGARLVLTRVPTPDPMPGAGPARFASLLGVPLVLGDVPALSTHDGSHLSEGSAHDWSQSFMTALDPYIGAVRAAAPRP